MPTQQLIRGVLVSGVTTSKMVSQTAGALVQMSVSIADSVTDQQVDVALDVSQIKSVFINSDQDVTLETNSGSAPAETIALLANKPLTWVTGDYYANLFATDITALFLTNASGSTAVVQIEILYDPTV